MFPSGSPNPSPIFRTKSELPLRADLCARLQRTADCPLSREHQYSVEIQDEALLGNASTSASIP